MDRRINRAPPARHLSVYDASGAQVGEGSCVLNREPSPGERFLARVDWEQADPPRGGAVYRVDVASSRMNCVVAIRRREGDDPSGTVVFERLPDG
jgi:hypothetical protein